MHNSQPIGVFDSGVGGLTVLKALQQSLPNESFLYLGDTARLPYGTKSPETVERYAQQASEILIKRGVKLLVVACNTATTLALPLLQQVFNEIPVIGVLQPGAEAACAASRSGKIAVIATEATIQSEGYQRAIGQIRADAEVVARSCSLFVALAEEGWLDGPIVQAVAERYLADIFTIATPPDCLVLGCTHFPVLLPILQQVVGPNVHIVDSAKTTAAAVAATLAQKQLTAAVDNPAYTHFLVTDAPHRFVRVANHLLGIQLNPANVELVDLAGLINSPASSLITCQLRAVPT